MIPPLLQFRFVRFCVTALTALLLAGCANRVFYQPARRWADTPDARGRVYQPVAFNASDGVRLTGWWLPAEGPSKGTVVHFHGNAQNMSTHVQFAEWLPQSGYNLFVFDYRGYGKSGGRPGRPGLVRDGVAALRTAAERAGEDPNLFVWGQSLGGTVALHALLHTDVPVRGAVIDSTFYSHPAITADKLKHFPWYLQWLRLFRPILVTAGFDAADAVPQLPNLPLAFLHMEEDPIVPSTHSRRLYERAPGSPRLWIIPGRGHADAVLRHPNQVRPLLLHFFETNAR